MAACPAWRDMHDPVPPSDTRHRLVVLACALGAMVMFALAYAERDDQAAALLWVGYSVFTGSVPFIVASMSIGPRPLRSFGVGAWLTVAASDLALVWMGRDATAANDGRGVVIPPMAVGLVPLGLWMMIRRPEQKWER